MISDDSLRVILNVLSDVRVGVADPHAEAAMAALRRAFLEVQKELGDREQGRPASG